MGILKSIQNLTYRFPLIANSLYIPISFATPRPLINQMHEGEYITVNLIHPD